MQLAWKPLGPKVAIQNEIPKYWNIWPPVHQEDTHNLVIYLLEEEWCQSWTPGKKAALRTPLASDPNLPV